MKKDIRGYEGLYYATADGNIFSYGGKSNHKNDIMLKPSFDKDGYRRVTLQSNKVKKYYRVNRLIAETFIPNTHNLPFVNHINEIRHDDRVENLEWVTGYENWHKSSNQTKKAIKINKVCKKTLKILTTYNSLMEASRANNINQGNITNCIKGRCKSVGGYFWTINSGYAN